ncbi:NIPSNAP family protein [Frondihabitans sp. VKM Ac-2883]|nr:NIPSNAP family protein [Frondihabitans sp. VKM Ac-2883]
MTTSGRAPLRRGQPRLGWRGKGRWRPPTAGEKRRPGARRRWSWRTPSKSDAAKPKALALFTFESLSAYEAYRTNFGIDPDFIAADKLRTDTGCVLRWDRTLMRPLPPR